MAERADLLIELGGEELPPKSLTALSEEFTRGVVAGLDKVGFEHGDAESFATPRRLAMIVSAVAPVQASRMVERRGPAVTAAFDADGNPTKAALGFARSCGVEMDALTRIATDKGEWLVFRAEEGGASLTESLADIVTTALAGLPIPKRMRWGSGTAEFVRPVHWLVMLHGNEVVPGQVLGLASGRVSVGHRSMSAGPISIANPNEYARVLHDHGHVIASFAARRERIRNGVTGIAASVHGTALIDEVLLDEVSALVEWPVPLVGAFDQRFLAVPQEALISSMQAHQKCFPVVDAQGRLLPHFIAVANLESANPEVVRTGNERVIRPRLADAEFFWNQDRKRGLAGFAEGLESMTYQARLGSLGDKSRRVASLASSIAGELGFDSSLAERAAQLAKADLLSAMVYEFPELQGVMGRYYATAEGEPGEICAAIEEQYLPRFAGDALPKSGAGICIALADRVDTLVGIFAIGQRPSGNKDPYGLRRAALGVLRILIEGGRDLDLRALLLRAASQLPDGLGSDTVTDDVFAYVMERLKVYYGDVGIAFDTVDAVMALAPVNPLDVDRRVRAIHGFRGTDAGQSLGAANKRIGNILRKAEDDAADAGFDPGMLIENAERALWNAVETCRGQAAAAFRDGDYDAGLAALAPLREPVDAFFDGVMVMAEDDAIRRNRLALLRELSGLFLGAGDLSRLQD